MFPIPKQVFIQKNPYPKVFSTLPTPNQRKTCIKHTFLTKKDNRNIFHYRPTYPIFFQTVTGNKQFLFLGLLTNNALFFLIQYQYLVSYHILKQVNLDMTDSMGPGKLVRHIQNLSYTYDEHLIIICIGLGQSISSVICKWSIISKFTCINAGISRTLSTYPFDEDTVHISF